MFSKQVYNSIQSPVAREDYMVETLVAPTVASIRKKIAGWSVRQREAAMKAYDCKWCMVEGRMVNDAVSAAMA